MAATKGWRVTVADGGRPGRNGTYSKSDQSSGEWGRVVRQMEGRTRRQKSSLGRWTTVEVGTGLSQVTDGQYVCPVSDSATPSGQTSFYTKVPLSCVRLSLFLVFSTVTSHRRPHIKSPVLFCDHSLRV